MIDDVQKKCDNELANSWELGHEAQNTEWDYHSTENKPIQKPPVTSVIWGYVANEMEQ